MKKTPVLISSLLILVLLSASSFPAISASAAPNRSKMIGINGAFAETRFVTDAHDLGVQWMRVEQWGDNTPYGTVPDTLTRLNAQNIRMLPQVNNYGYGMVSSSDKTAWINQVVHAATTYGAGGSWWNGKTDKGSPIIEVGNEVYGQWYPWPDKSYLRPDQYALMLKQASIAVTAATGGKVKIIASTITDYLDTSDLSGGAAGTWKQWDAEMKRAVPDIAGYLGGIAVHPYGDIADIGIGSSRDPNWSHQVMYSLHDRWNLPVYVTEVGQKGPAIGFSKQAEAVAYYFNEFKTNDWIAGLFWYNQKDYSAYDPGADNGWALIDNTDKRLPAWFEYQKQALAFFGNTVPGDVNDDGKVQLDDLSLLLANYNRIFAPADFNQNNKVDLPDLSILLANYKFGT